MLHPLIVQFLFFSPQLEPVRGTHCSVYGLQTNINHEVRVRCRMLGYEHYGEFSDPIIIHIPSKGKHSGFSNRHDRLCCFETVIVASAVEAAADYPCHLELISYVQTI